ncbi:MULTISPECIES: hypothetical protein [Acinetobacter]|uniref:hypothetical protein n=1 Tax=Acinetobacter TaxID=469 RepID=UPI000D0B8DDE|nr:MULTISPECIES: hypothetical protein [Acinetobacter]MCX0339612.1 hypothetical protein [Acinetobacter radioresistens]PSD36133.1 hypothetical protein C7E16_08470 [Acinetobacter radioresistens]PSD39349.1 hypothetical protein C7E21_04500 [Acinetobacter radioresistens]
MKILVLKGVCILIVLAALLSLGQGIFHLDLFFVLIGLLLGIAAWLIKAEYSQYQSDPFQ